MEVFTNSTYVLKQQQFLEAGHGHGHADMEFGTHFTRTAKDLTPKYSKNYGLFCQLNSFSQDFF